MTCTGRDGTTDSTDVLPAKGSRRIIILTKDITVTIIITREPFTQDFTIPAIIMPPVIPSGGGTMDIPGTATTPTTEIITTPPGSADINTKVVDLKSTAEIITSANRAAAKKAEIIKAAAKKAVKVVEATGFVDSFRIQKKAFPCGSALFIARLID